MITWYGLYYGVYRLMSMSRLAVAVLRKLLLLVLMSYGSLVR